MDTETRTTFNLNTVPWQVWAVVILLGLEGINNYMMISKQPLAIVWLAAKILFIIGLLKRWRWVYVLFLIVSAIHVIIFANAGAIIISLMNLVLVILAVWVFRYYFPINNSI